MCTVHCPLSDISTIPWQVPLSTVLSQVCPLSTQIFHWQVYPPSQVHPQSQVYLPFTLRSTLCSNVQIFLMSTDRSVPCPLSRLTAVLSQVCLLSTQIFLVSADWSVWTLFTDKFVHWVFSQVCRLSKCSDLSNVYWQVHPLSTDT